MSDLTAEQEVELEEAKLVAEEEARLAVKLEREDGETDEEVLKNLFNQVYENTLGRALFKPR
jgi:hypothetical protein